MKSLIRARHQLHPGSGLGDAVREMRGAECAEDRSLLRWGRGALVVALVLGTTLYKARTSLQTGDQLNLAYLDPGVGSLMIQALIAGFASAAVAVRIYWKGIKRFLGFRSADAKEDETERKADSDE